MITHSTASQTPRHRSAAEHTASSAAAQRAEKEKKPALRKKEEKPLQGKGLKEEKPKQAKGLKEKKPPVQGKYPVQRQENKTGMSDSLKSGIESLSGHDMSDVRVHYNSSRPAQLNALAYAQGSDIHVASGQEKHVAHEAWHVVQQKEGRVQPTTQVGGTPVNDNVGLEKEADVMGAKALQMKHKPGLSHKGGAG